MAKEKVIKTNAIRMLDKAKVPYVHRSWEQATGQHTGVELAAALGQNPEQVFKTLVTVAKSGEHYVFLVPVAEELDLKKAAAAVGEKAISMCKSKDLLALTGYIHGGCSPIGMKNCSALPFMSPHRISPRSCAVPARSGTSWNCHWTVCSRSCPFSWRTSSRRKHNEILLYRVPAGGTCYHEFRKAASGKAPATGVPILFCCTTTFYSVPVSEKSCRKHCPRIISTASPLSTGHSGSVSCSMPWHRAAVRSWSH